MRVFACIAILAVIMPMMLCMDQVAYQRFLDSVIVQGNNKGCISFTPLTAPGTNCNDVAANVPAGHVEALLDRIYTQTPFRCIQMYGFFEPAVQAAKARGFKVMVVLFLDMDTSKNVAMLNNVISSATSADLRDTLISFSCGNEMRAKDSNGFDNKNLVEPVINDCLTRLRNGGVPQPLTTNSVYYAWCNFEPNDPWCSKWNFGDNVDYIGTNIYPFYDNKYVPNGCVNANTAASKHMQYVQTTRAQYPGKQVIVTEWGWPSGPSGFYFSDCDPSIATSGILPTFTASEYNQDLVVKSSLGLFASNYVGSVLFSSHRNPCKISEEPYVGPYWGVCSQQYPYNCKTTIYSY